jgi:hypothetical protein
MASQETPGLTCDDDVLARLIKLGGAQCTRQEAAQALGRTEDEFNSFLDNEPKARVAFEQGAAEQLERLRAAQFKLAETSPVMAIFLGKQYLGQAERRELDQSAQAQIAGAAERLRRKLAVIAADLDAADDHRDPGETSG